MSVISSLKGTKLFCTLTGGIDKKPWPFWSLFLFSLLLNPISVLILVSENTSRLGQKKLSKKLFLFGLLFLFITSILYGLISLFLFGTISDISLLGLFTYCLLLFIAPIWIVLIERTAGFIALFFFITSLIILGWFFFFVFRKVKVKSRFNSSVLIWVALSLVVSFILGYLIWIFISFNYHHRHFRFSAVEKITTPNYQKLLPKDEDAKVYEITKNPLTLLDTGLKDVPYRMPYDNYYSIYQRTQPAFFDPLITSYQREEVFSDDYYDRDKLIIPESDVDYCLVINGEWIDNDNIIDLPHPYSLTYYTFGCNLNAGRVPTSYILDIARKNKRAYLFSHVQNFVLSSDAMQFYIADIVKTEEDKWIDQRRILDFSTGEVITLPNTRCVYSLAGFWWGERLITLGPHGDYQDLACVWDRQGNLLARIETSLYYQAGLLPTNKDIFFAIVDPTQGQTECYVVLQNIFDQDKSKFFKLSIDEEKKPSTCEEFEIKLDNLSFDSEHIEYRIRDYSQGIQDEDWYTSFLINISEAD